MDWNNRKTKNMLIKPCPFCQNSNVTECDCGDSCCFCDYEGIVTIGKFCTFSNIDQYNTVYLASCHQDRLDALDNVNSGVYPHTY